MQKRDRGITLIALVITIVILLILAGIAINQLTGDNGLFARAKQAKQNTIDAQEKENAILEEYEEEINKYAGETLASKVKAGDYVEYTLDTVSSTDEKYTTLISNLGTYSGSSANTTSTLTQETSLKWRVLDVKDGKVRLISEVPTTSKITLNSYNGYNNAVYLLDKTCSTLYNNSKYAEKVQSLKIEDIQKYMTITDYSKINSSYGKTLSPTSKKYPSIFAQEEGQTVDGTTETLKLSEQTTPINQATVNTATSWTVKYTCWIKAMAESDFTKPIYYNLFINNGNNYSIYWMSSRCVDAYSGDAGFLVRVVNSSYVGASYLYFASDVTRSNSYALRPVVTLKSNVQIDTVAGGDGTANTPYAIK